jgi:tRNA G46 methylase TrmB
VAHDYETRVLQDLAEHDAFMALLRAENVRSYLELGLGSGGSLWRIANSLPSGSRVVGLDLHIVSATRTEPTSSMASPASKDEAMIHTLLPATAQTY